MNYGKMNNLNFFPFPCLQQWWPRPLVRRWSNQRHLRYTGCNQHRRGGPSFRSSSLQCLRSCICAVSTFLGSWIHEKVDHRLPLRCQKAAMNNLDHFQFLCVSSTHISHSLWFSMCNYFCLFVIRFGGAEVGVEERVIDPPQPMPGSSLSLYYLQENVIMTPLVPSMPLQLAQSSWLPFTGHSLPLFPLQAGISPWFWG